MTTQAVFEDVVVRTNLRILHSYIIYVCYSLWQSVLRCWELGDPFEW